MWRTVADVSALFTCLELDLWLQCWRSFTPAETVWISEWRGTLMEEQMRTPKLKSHEEVVNHEDKNQGFSWAVVCLLGEKTVNLSAPDKREMTSVLLQFAQTQSVSKRRRQITRDGSTIDAVAVLWTTSVQEKNHGDLITFALQLVWLLRVYETTFTVFVFLAPGGQISYLWSEFISGSGWQNKSREYIFKLSKNQRWTVLSFSASDDLTGF